MIKPWRRRHRDLELDEELAVHMRMAIEERVARGERREDAERAARREFGNVGVVKEVTREMWGGGWFERLLQDVRYGARTLRRSPGFTIVALSTLALGIGATTAMFTVVHAVLLRPLSYPRSDRLVRIAYDYPKSPFITEGGISDRQWVDARSRYRMFTRVAAFTPGLVTLTNAGDPVRLQEASVAAGLFETLGITPALGRTFGRDDELVGGEPVVILGDALWRERFGADSNAVGRPITLDGVRHTVLGVMPQGFAYPLDARLWRPLRLQLAPNRFQILSVIGRLRDGATRAQALAELDALAAADRARDSMVARVTPLKDTVVGDVTRSLLVFAGAVGLVLLIACTNVANLLLMRATTRRREMAVRAALGAGRRRLVRQLVTESALLWVGAGVAGAGIAVAGVRALLALAPAGRIPRHGEIGVDAVALAFALVVSLGTGLIFGLIPALRATGSSVRDALAASARTMTGRDGRLRGALVMAEIAFALVLLTGAALMMESFIRLRRVELGFRPEGLASLTVDLPDATYQSAPAMQAAHEAVLDRLEKIRGVTSAAAVNFIPLGGPMIRGDIKVDGRTLPPSYLVAKPSVSPGYFRTMGIRLRLGREFTAQDAASSPHVVIVSESVARQIWPDLSPIGQRISNKDVPGPGDWLTVVGVVDDVGQTSIDVHREPAIYQPIQQLTQTFFLGHMSFIVRAVGDPALLLPMMRRALRDVDPNQPIGSIGTVESAISATVAEPLFQARLIGAFSIVALVLAAIGIYGVVAYSVAERTREIGIRVALGAGRGDVVGMVLRRLLVLLVPGVALGVAGALATTRVLSSLLFEIRPDDPATFISVAVLLAAVAIVAGMMPARRASRVDPLVALKEA
ncbi:MAG TPA: ABC transporter permease [Gemmatimonadaceae bacterium]|nr:ABC transporter permease [Gemmatimonadaceae bacterium]